MTVGSCTYTIHRVHAEQERLSALAKSLRVLEGEAESAAAGGEAAGSSSYGGAPAADAYRRDAIRNISTCFRCCELWAYDGDVEKVTLSSLLLARSP